MRNNLRRLAEASGHWAGIPMPVGREHPLVIEPRFPHADALMAMTAPAPDEDDGKKADIDQYPDPTVRNIFWSWHWKSWITVFEYGAPGNRKITWGKRAEGSHHASIMLGSLAAADAWGIEQEATAVQTLGTLLRHRQFKQYMLTGMFLERSRRSGISYLFRRLRPTLALSTSKPDTRIIAALCLHPIGYYQSSWAGAMCPTDDVIGHLQLMRGDEAMFWRRANQHPPWAKEAGIG